MGKAPARDIFFNVWQATRQQNELTINKKLSQDQKQIIADHVKEKAVCKSVSGAPWSKGRLASQHTAVSKLVS